jgi:hypothetical protein
MASTKKKIIKEAAPKKAPLKKAPLKKPVKLTNSNMTLAQKEAVKVERSRARRSLKNKTKDYLIKVRKNSRPLLIALLFIVILSFILQFKRVADVVADAFGMPEIATQLMDAAIISFNASMALLLMWLALSVVASPVIALTLGLAAIAFASIAVYKMFTWGDSSNPELTQL